MGGLLFVMMDCVVGLFHLWLTFNLLVLIALLVVQGACRS